MKKAVSSNIAQPGFSRSAMRANAGCREQCRHGLPALPGEVKYQNINWLILQVTDACQAGDAGLRHFRLNHPYGLGPGSRVGISVNIRSNLKFFAGTIIGLIQNQAELLRCDWFVWTSLILGYRSENNNRTGHYRSPAFRDCIRPVCFTGKAVILSHRK